MQFNNPLGKIKNMTTPHLKKSIGRSSSRLALLLIPVVFACFALCPMAQAVSPAPDGAYPGGNTAEGTNALLSLTTGQNNTAVGVNSLSSTTDGGSNTAIGGGALRFNTSVENTAVGFQALFRNSTGQSNTATGFAALQLNTTGRFNTATGLEALRNNTTGSDNTAMGSSLLLTTQEAMTTRPRVLQRSEPTLRAATTLRWEAMPASTSLRPITLFALVPPART
jgi:hypothetical protein